MNLQTILASTLILTFSFSAHSASWDDEITRDIIECENSLNSKKTVFRYVERYSNVENKMRKGFHVSKVDSWSEYELVTVYEDESPLAFFAVTEDNQQIHFRSVSMDEVDLTDTDLHATIPTNPFNLSGLKKFGLALVHEFIFDKENSKVELRSLQAIGHSASIYDDLGNYTLENCTQIDQVPAKYLSNGQTFDEL